MTELPPEETGAEEAGQAASGDRFELSGDFRGAVINIKSTLVGSAEVFDLEQLSPEPGEPPFQGLQHFDESDSDRFFGRELLVARIIGRMHRTPFLSVIGASGSGKSSLIRAGVIPALKSGTRLEDGGLPPQGSGNWAYHLITPGARPLESLASALTPENEPLSSISALAGEIEAETSAFRLAVRRYLSTRSKSRLLLVVDQFEELYTLTRRPDERDAFIRTLLTSLDPEEAPSVGLLISLRADYYAQVAQHDELREAVSQHQEFIGAMNRDELVRAIDRPLAQGDWKIQEGLIEVVLDDVGYEPGSLPLLSHALLETWKRRRGRTLTLSGYREAGGVRGAIAETAETVFRRQLTPEQQSIARMIFVRLTEIGEDSSDTRRRTAFSELITRSTDELTIDTVIKILSDSRLVITGTARPGDVKVVEVAHEAIIREWPTLREWLEEDREGLILHQNLGDDAEDWVRLDRDPGILYRGARLDLARGWADRHPDQLNIQEQEFLQESQIQADLEASERARLERATRIQRISIGAMAILIVVVGFLAYSIFYVNEPAEMDGLYNIAIARIGSASNGQTGSPSSGIAADLTDIVYSTLNDTLGENPNILVWHDGPELDGTYVEIGAVGDPAEGLETPEEMANRLHADMVIYGVYDSASSPGELDLNYYLAPREDYNYEGIQGTFQLEEIAIDPEDADNPGSPGRIELAGQVESLAWVSLGLSEAQLGRSVEALEAFLRAEQVSPLSADIQFFIGREYLFLVDRESVLELAREAFEELAEMAFKKSISINPEYERAHVGLAGVYFKRSRNLLSEAVLQPDERISLLEEALEDNSLAITAYSEALRIAESQELGDIPLEANAGLGLGNAYRLRGDILTQLGEYAEAESYIDQALTLLEKVPSSLVDPGHVRYQTQAYEYLGGANESLGILLELSQQYDASLLAYQDAIDYYTRCIEQGNLTQDLIVTREIIEDVCIPRRQGVQDILDSVSGGQ